MQQSSEDSPAPVECEIKLALAGEGDYERLLESLPGRVWSRLQHNVFYDSPNRRLAAQGWALRLRREDEGPTLTVTVKGGGRAMGSAVYRPEWEVVHDVEIGSFPPPVLPAALRDCGPLTELAQRGDLPERLEPLVAFRNQRTAFRIELDGQSRLLELDRTEFASGEIDCEIEVELPVDPDPAQTVLGVKGAEADLRRLLGEHGVNPAPGRGGKFARALRYAGFDS